MKKINVVNDVTSLDQDFFNTLQNNVEEVFNGEEPMGSIRVADVECKNKFDINTMVELTNAYRGHHTGEIIWQQSYNGIKVPVKPNTTYAFSSNGTDWSNLTFYDENFNYISGSFFAKENILTTPDNCYYFCLAMAADYTWVQVEEDNKVTSPTKHKKFGYNSQDSMGKIVVDDIRCKNKLYTPFTEDNKLTITATRDDYFIVTDYRCYLEGGKTYTISFETDGQVGSSVDDTVEIMLYYNKTTEYTYSSPDKIGTFTPPLSGYYFLRLDVNKNGATHSFWNFQIEEGDKATNWIQHKEFSNKHIYSTEEQIVGTWVDGKTLYEKIISFRAPNNNLDIFPHNISNVDTIWIDSGSSYFENADIVPTRYLISDYDWHIAVSATHITAEATSDRSYGTMVVTLKYTKNTQPAMMYSPRPDTTEEGELDG